MNAEQKFTAFEDIFEKRRSNTFNGYLAIRDGFFGKKGFTPMIAPAIVRKEHFFGTGHLPGDAEDLFETQDDDYLSGTAEVPIMGYYSNEILTKKIYLKSFWLFLLVIEEKREVMEKIQKV
ncbi:MAG: hypothetical protein R3B65_02665 [Candidatus Paceibacterota bacterium]